MAVPGRFYSSVFCSGLYLLFRSVPGFRVYQFWFRSGSVPFRVLGSDVPVPVPVPFRVLGITPPSPQCIEV